MPSDTYAAATAWEAEGARVALVTCRRCGAAVLIDPRDVASERGTVLHDAWHDREGGDHADA